jgi:Tol biopolymer transport system component
MKRRTTAIALAAAASLALTASLPAASAAAESAGSTVLISGPNREVSGFPAEDEAPAISGDGSWTGFVRDAFETGSAVYLGYFTGETRAIDIPSGLTEQGQGFDAGAPSLSGDGQYIAFASEDPNLSEEDRDYSTTPAGDTFPVRDIFVYERAEKRISLISRGSGQTGKAGNEDSSNPSISADGDWIAFQTEATNLQHGVFGGVFVRDQFGSATTLASRASGAHGKPLRGFVPSISAHGRWVAFLTVAHLRHGHALEVAVRDMRTKRTTLVSRAGGADGALAAGDCGPPALSANGRYVAFATKARNLGGGRGGVEDVFVRDLRTKRTILVSRAKGKRGAAGSGDSSEPSISASGRYVAFQSYASNLGPPDNGAIPDVFVRDMRSGRVFLASRASGNGEASNAPSSEPSISAEGRWVAFASHGSNLSAEDPLHASSVYRYQALP